MSTAVARVARVFYEVFCAEHTTGPVVLLLPTWSIIHSRFWKVQAPYLARHYRVITFDGRGSGRSDRPLDPVAYTDNEFVADALAVLDTVAVPRAVVISLSMGAEWALRLAALHPQRVAGAVFTGLSLPIPPGHKNRAIRSFDEQLDTDEGWAKYNRYYWLKDYRGFAVFFFSQCFPEPHSTKPIEDCVGWALETTPQTLLTKHDAPSPRPPGEPEDDEQYIRALAARVRCPVLVIHGDQDNISPHARGAAFAAMTGGQLATLEGSGHIPLARDPVKVNLLLRAFIEETRTASGDSPAPTEPPRLSPG